MSQITYFGCGYSFWDSYQPFSSQITGSAIATGSAKLAESCCLNIDHHIQITLSVIVLAISLGDCSWTLFVNLLLVKVGSVRLSDLSWQSTFE